MTQDFNETALTEMIAALGPSKTKITMRGNLYAVFQIKSGKEIIATGSIFDADGKTLDKKAINAVTEMAVSLGYPIETVMIWRPKKGGGGTGHKRAELRGNAKPGELRYKAVAA
jgi:acetyl/propionyl-CoA carboxylase alpha subunit